MFAQPEQIIIGSGSEQLYEAVTRIPADDEAQKGTVVDVVEKGYYLNDKVLRYAKVVVAF